MGRNPATGEAIKVAAKPASVDVRGAWYPPGGCDRLVTGVSNDGLTWWLWVAWAGCSPAGRSERHSGAARSVRYRGCDHISLSNAARVAPGSARCSYS